METGLNTLVDEQPYPRGGGVGASKYTPTTFFQSPDEDSLTPKPQAIVAWAQPNVRFQSPDEDSLTPKYPRLRRFCDHRGSFQSPDEDSLTPKRVLLLWDQYNNTVCFSPLTRIRLPQRRR